jgi:hypothetical protein
LARLFCVFSGLTQVEQVQELIGVHSIQARVLLIDHCRGHVDLESLETSGEISFVDSCNEKQSELTSGSSPPRYLS